MTKNRRSKQSIRARAAKTGSSFSAASNNSHREPAPRRHLPIAPHLDLRTAYLATNPLLRSTPIDALWFVRIERTPEDRFNLTTPALPEMDRQLAQGITRVQHEIAKTHPILEGPAAMRLVDITRRADGSARKNLKPSAEQRRKNVEQALRYATEYPASGSKGADDAERAIAIIRAWLDGDTETTSQERGTLSRHARAYSAADGVPGASQRAAHAAGCALAVIDAPLDGRNLVLAAMIHSGEALASHLTDPTEMWLDRLDDYITHDATTYGLPLDTISVNPDGREIARQAAAEHLANRGRAEREDRERDLPAALARYAPSRPSHTRPEKPFEDFPDDGTPALTLGVRGWEQGFRPDAHEFATLEVGLPIGHAMRTTSRDLIAVIDTLAQSIMDEREEIVGDDAAALLVVTRLTLGTYDVNAADKRHADAVVGSHMAQLAMDTDPNQFDHSVEKAYLRAPFGSPADYLKRGHRHLAEAEAYTESIWQALAAAEFAIGNDAANGEDRELAQRAIGAAPRAFESAGHMLARGKSVEEQRRVWTDLAQRYVTIWRTMAKVPQQPPMARDAHQRAIVLAEAHWLDHVARSGVPHAAYAEKRAEELRASLA